MKDNTIEPLKDRLAHLREHGVTIHIAHWDTIPRLKLEQTVAGGAVKYMELRYVPPIEGDRCEGGYALLGGLYGGANRRQNVDGRRFGPIEFVLELADAWFLDPSVDWNRLPAAPGHP